MEDKKDTNFKALTQSVIITSNIDLSDAKEALGNTPGIIRIDWSSGEKLTVVFGTEIEFYKLIHLMMQQYFTAKGTVYQGHYQHGIFRGEDDSSLQLVFYQS